MDAADLPDHSAEPGAVSRSVLRGDLGPQGLRAPLALLLMKEEVVDHHLDVRQLDFLVDVIGPLVDEVGSATRALGGVDLFLMGRIQQGLLMPLVPFLASALSLLLFLLAVRFLLLAAVLEGTVRRRRLVGV